MLSKELKDMELNKLVKRNVYPETPVLIEYEPTEYCRTFGNIIMEMINWGREHRRVIVEDKI
jgi:DNA-binding HxlR family transcriptional regulator